MLFIHQPQPINELLGLLTKAMFIIILVWLNLRIFMRFKKRSDAVHEYRVNLINRVSTLCQSDIENGHAWRWRYKKMCQVGYYKLVFRYWIPLEDERIYKDLSFLDPKVIVKNAQ